MLKPGALAASAAAALATGGLYAASFGARPGATSLAAFALVAYVPLFVALGDVRSLTRALTLGWIAGITACAFGFAWLVTPMRAEGGLPLPFALALYAPFVATQALRFATHAGLAYALHRRAGIAPSVAFALAFVLSERFAPAIIPWNFSAALVDLPPTLALAPWLGPVGAALGAIACNAALLECALHLRRRLAEDPKALRLRNRSDEEPKASHVRKRSGEDDQAPRRALAWLCLSIALASLGWSGVSAALSSLGRPEPARERAEAEPPLRVGVVQAPSVAGNGAPDPAKAWQRLIELHREARLQDATIVAMGEGALPFDPYADELDGDGGRLYGTAFAVPTLVGAIVREALGAEQPAGEQGDGRAKVAMGERGGGAAAAGRRRGPTNSVLAFSDRGFVGRYDKILLLPFSEYLPFEASFPWLRALSPASGRFRAGERSEPLRLAGHVFAPSICFEDLFAARAREAAASPEVGALFNATNDGWFGDTSEPWVHLAHARLRAAEVAKPLIRAATTGPSALVDARGHVVALAEPFRDAVLVADLRPSVGAPTPYARWGDLAWITALSALALASARRKRAEPGGPYRQSATTG